MPDPDDTSTSTEEEIPNQMSITYRKTNQYRVYHIDGIHGGLTTKGDVQGYLYSTSTDLPDRSVREVSEEGMLGPEEHQSESEAGFVREVESSIKMSPEVALQVIDWLIGQVRAAEYYGMIEEEDLEAFGIEPLEEPTETDGE